MVFLPQNTETFDYSLANMIMLIALPLALIVFFRNEIIRRLAKKFGLTRLYQTKEWIDSLVLVAFILWIVWLLIEVSIETATATETGLTEYWLRLWGILIVLIIPSFFFDSLSLSGKVHVFFSEARNKLNDSFVKSKPWLMKGLEEVENYLRLREIVISGKTVLYKLSILSLKNEDIRPILINVENAILNPTNDPSLYKQLVEILGDEKEIKSLQKTYDKVRGWLGGLSPYQVLYLIMIAIGLIIFLIMQRFPLPIK